MSFELNFIASQNVEAEIKPKLQHTDDIRKY